MHDDNSASYYASSSSCFYGKIMTLSLCQHGRMFDYIKNFQFSVFLFFYFYTADFFDWSFLE